MEDFVSFEIAKKLKEKGFREDCIAKVNLDNTITFNHVFDNDIRTVLKCHNKLNPYIDAPTISQVLKWLRKEKKYHVYAAYGAVSKFRYVIIQLDNEDAKYTIKRHYKTYEDAIMAGINYVINNII